MRRVRAFLLRLAGLFGRERCDLDLADEIESNLQMHFEDNLRLGMTPAEARRNALIRLGGVQATKELYRDRRSLPALETLVQDLRFASRVLRKNPGFALTTALTLALTIGANTAMFSVVNAVILRPLPYRDAERLVSIWGRNDQLGVNQGNLSLADIVDFRRQSGQLESIAAWTLFAINLVEETRSERLEGILVSTNFFQTLGVRIEAGRDFEAGDAQEGRDDVAIISDGLWRRRFGADPAIIGRRLKLNSYDTNGSVVVGVAPPEVLFPLRTDVWIPQTDEPGSVRGGHDLRAVARLKPGASPEQAQSELNVIAQALEQHYPGTNMGWRVALTSVVDAVLGTPYKALWVLICAVGCVLLIGCANISNLQLARSTRRSDEMALRVALGAGRARIVRQLLTESVLLAAIGGMAGVVLAWWGVAWLRVAGPDTIPRLREAAINERALVFTGLVTLLATVAFGLIPAWQGSRLDLKKKFREGTSFAPASASAARLRGMLVISEIAISVLLLVGAGLFLKSFWLLQNVDPGFKADHALTAGISLNWGKYMQSQERRILFFSQVIQRVRALKGVESVGAISHLPFGGRGVNLGFSLDGHEVKSGEDTTRAELRVVSPDYFEAMGIPLKQGRPFTERDTRFLPPAVIVNEAFVRQFFSDRVAIGCRMRIDISENGFSGEIVGVAGNVRHLGYDAEPRPEMFISYLQNPVWPVMNLAVRTRNEPGDMAAAVRHEIEAVDSTQAIFNVRPLAAFLSDSIAQRRFSLLLLVVFASAALATAGAGIYGVMAYSVAERTHEISVRMAVGAQRLDILNFIIGRGLKLVVFGLALGMVAALILTRLIRSLLYGVSALDPATLVMATVLLAAIALLACYLPASRATKVDPLFALRHE